MDLPVPEHLSMQSDKGLKVWQVWPGTHRFCCDGRLMFGPDIGVTWFAFFLVTTASTTFWVAVCPSLPVAVIVVGVALYIATVWFMYRTATTDPGIIPRNTTMTDDEAAACATEQRVVEINGVTVPLKFCRTCRIFRPPRTAHCSECNVCVEKFDHHCPWMGQCIGRRNYRYFLRFVTSVVALSAYTACFSALAAYRASLLALHGDFISRALQRAPMALVMLLFTSLILLCIGPLWIYHCMLVCKNRTTSEEVKETYGRSNPFSISLAANCTEACCEALHEPRLLPRALVSEVGTRDTLGLMQAVEDWRGPHGMDDDGGAHAMEAAEAGAGEEMREMRLGREVRERGGSPPPEVHLRCVAVDDDDVMRMSAGADEEPADGDVELQQKPRRPVDEEV